MTDAQSALSWPRALRLAVSAVVEAKRDGGEALPSPGFSRLDKLASRRGYELTYSVGWALTQRGTIGPVTVEGNRLWELLRSLDDAEHLEFPAGYDHREDRNRFNQLVDRLDAGFSCACRADRHVEDASYHGSIEIPAEATATGERLVIVVSNFGGLAVVAIENPGVYTRAEFTELLHPDDAERVQAALGGLGYTIVPEESLWEPYDGNGPLRHSYPVENPPTWWIRFFDYLLPALSDSNLADDQEAPTPATSVHLQQACKAQLT